MTRHPRWLRAATAGAVAVLLALCTTGGAAASPLSRGAPPTPSTVAAVAPGGTANAGGRTVAQLTLVTGDVVTVGVDTGGAFTAEVTVRAARPGNQAIWYSTVRQGDALYVYPSDALGLVDAGLLDRRLFDVAYLAKNGYAGRLPLIVQYPARTLNPQLSGLAQTLPGITGTPKGLASVHGAAVSVDRAKAGQFWAGVADARSGALRQGLAKVWLDGTVHADLDQSVPMIGAPEAWAAGYTGTGVKVAVLDSGIDATHPDLAGRIAAAASFVPDGSTADRIGHGTHVASTIIGSGAASGGKYKGVAPDASLLAGKVIEDSGYGSDSEIIAGMQWAVAQGARIVSMSLGGCCTDGTDPMSQAVDTLSAQSGALFVIAAGNDGADGPLTINTPGTADAALTVAAVDKQDKLAAFSSRGPRQGDFGPKPDIAAPGVSITAARAAGTTLGPIVDEQYTTLSGTSMATPHVAGAATLLAQEHPDWTGDQLKYALMSTAKDDGYGAYEQGTGRVDVARAVQQSVFATGSIDFDKIPYSQTTPVTRQVTYTNNGAAPVTLNLTATVTAHRGTAPPGTLRLEQNTVTVPAHGTATATVTFNPVGAPQTWYEGAVRASAAGVALTTAVVGFRDLKQVTFTGKVITPDGARDLSWGGWQVLMIDGRDEVPVIGESEAGGDVSAPFYAGHYAVRTFVRWRDSNGAPNSALVVVPDADLTSDATVVFDLRKAKRLATTLPRPGEPYVQQFGFTSTAAGGGVSVTSEIREYGGNTLWTLPTAAKPSLGDFYAYNQRVYTAPRLSMRVSGRLGALDARYPAANAAVSDDEIARFTGQHRLPAVDGGHGTPDDLAGLDVRGKLVLLDLSDLCATTCAGDAADRVAALAAAGAAGAMGFSATGRGFLDPDPDSIWPVYPIPTVSLPGDQGAQLRGWLAHGPRSIDVSGSASPEYVYALSYPWVDRIPSAVESTVNNRDVYRVDNRIHADAPGVATLSFIAQLPLPAGYRPGDPLRRAGSGNSLPVRGPGVVPTYYGPVQGNLGWFHGASFMYDAPDSVTGYHRNGWSNSRIDEFTAPGTRTDDLGEQPLASTATMYSATYAKYSIPSCLSCRNGDMLNPVNVLNNDGSGGGYQAYDISNGFYGDEQTQLHLYRDGTEIPVQLGIAWIAPPFFAYWNPYFTLPAPPARYRLTEHFTTDWVMQRYARTVDTAWTFASQRPTTGFTAPQQGGANCMGWYIQYPAAPDVCKATDQLFLGYDLGLDLDNTLPAGSVRRVTLRAFHSPLLSGAPAVTGLQLWTSTDGGAHWTAVRTTAVGQGKYTATLANPRSGDAGMAVSLRVQATDASGNTVDQTIQNAYGVR